MPCEEAQSPALDLPALLYGVDSHLQTRTNYLQTKQMYKACTVTKSGKKKKKKSDTNKNRATKKKLI